jgi:hypothetical protein
MPMAKNQHTTSVDKLHAEHEDDEGRPQTTLCPVAELDRRAEAAMAEADAAEERLLAEPLSGSHRLCLEITRDKARDRAEGHREAMAYATAKSKGGALAQLLELDSVVGSLAWAPEIKAVDLD